MRRRCRSLSSRELRICSQTLSRSPAGGVPILVEMSGRNLRFGRRLDHSMISSARASTDGGIVRPSALAVFRLMIRRTWVTSSTGRSRGVRPRKDLRDQPCGLNSFRFVIRSICRQPAKPAFCHSRKLCPGPECRGVDHGQPSPQRCHQHLSRHIEDGVIGCEQPVAVWDAFQRLRQLFSRANGSRDDLHAQTRGRFLGAPGGRSRRRIVHMVNGPDTAKARDEGLQDLESLRCQFGLQA